ncbi:MAG: hypothetical protein SGPRY_008574, partial [Prymnesium sp.]
AKEDFYSVLGLQKGVDDGTLRAAFKKLAAESHPDRFQGSERAEAEERFQRISEAYTVLSNVRSRATYDEELEKATISQAREAAVKKVKVESWNTEVPDLQARDANRTHPTCPRISTHAQVCSGSAACDEA